MDDKPKDVIRETDAEAIRLAKTLMRARPLWRSRRRRSGNRRAVRKPRRRRHRCRRDAAHSRLAIVGAHKGDPCRPPMLAASGRARQGRSPRPSAHYAGLPRREARTRDAPAYQAPSGATSTAIRRRSSMWASATSPFFRLEVERASLNGGFGKAYLLTRSRICTGSRSGWRSAGRFRAARAVDHMNDDHLDAITNYARHFAKADGGGWVDDGHRRGWHRYRCR